MPDNQSPTGAPSVDDFILETPNTSQTPTADPPAEPQIPDKYRGKSVADLIEMHQNAERRLSIQGNELGEMRRIADAVIGAAKPKDNARTVPERKPVTVDSLLSNPEHALTQTIEQSPVAQRADATAVRVDELEATIARNAFETRYPDAPADMQNPQFLEWVRKNRTRQGLAAQAYQGNYHAAAELWSLWDEVKGAQTPAVTPKPDAKAAVAAARVVRQGANEGAEPARIYSSAKLMALRERVQDGDQAAVATWNNPAFQTSLIQAYAEGRVR